MPSDPINIREMLETCERATPGPWTWGVTPDNQDGSKWLSDCFAKGSDNVCWLVVVPDGNAPIGDKAVVVATTGNGPTSEANSRFLTACSPDRVKRLLLVLRDATEELRRQRESHRSLATLFELDVTAQGRWAAAEQCRKFGDGPDILAKHGVTCDG